MKQNIHILTILKALFNKTEPQLQPPKKKTWPRRLIAFAFFAIFVSCLLLAAWSISLFLTQFLEKTQTYGSITIEPYQYSRNHFLSHQWDSVRVSGPDFSVLIESPHLRLFDVLSSKRSVLLKTSLVNIHIHPEAKDSTTKNFSLDSIKIPDFAIPVQVFLDFDSTSIILDSALSWQTQSIKLSNETPNNVALSIKSITGTHLESPVDLIGFIHFDAYDVGADLKIQTPEDSIILNINAPKNDLKSYKVNLNASIQKVEKWLPKNTIPNEVPALSKIAIQAELSENEDHSDIFYKGTLQLEVGEFWPLEPLKGNVSFSGDTKKIETRAVLKNQDGGEIELRGSIDFELDFKLEGNISNMSAVFGPQIMPLDIQIHSAIKKGNSISADLETRRGSKINADLSNLNSNPRIDYRAKISHTESWALDWCKGNLILSSPTFISGFFQDKKLHAQVTIAPVPYAYGMKADSVKTDLVLNSDGILFSNGEIHTPKDLFLFSGDVIWENSLQPHTSWNLTQSSGGKAKAWIDFADSIKIDAEVNQINVSTIPLAKSNFLEKIMGKVTGTWKNNFESNEGNAKIAVETTLNNFTIFGDFEVEQKQDTIFVQKAIVTHNKNKIEAEAIFLLPNDSTTPGILPVDVIHAWVSSYQFNIPLLLQALQDSTFKSASFSGDLAYNKEFGLQGNVNFQNIVFNHISEDLLSIHRLNLFAEKNKAELNAYLKIGSGGWDGNTQIILSDLFNQKRHLNISHVTSNGGVLWSDGFIDSSLTFNGLVQAKGSWFLPANAGEILKTDIKVDVSANLKKGLRGIHAQFYSDSSFYQAPFLSSVLPVSVIGELKDNVLTVSNLKTVNELGEELNVSAQLNLDSMKLEAIDFYSEQYSIVYDSIHWIQVKNLSGKIGNHEDQFAIYSDLFELAYKLDSPNLGQANAKVRGKLNLHIPHSKENNFINTSIDGFLFIDKAVYRKDFDVDISPKSIDRLLALFRNTLLKFRKTSQKTTTVSGSRPTNLSIHISDSQKDSVAVITSIAKFPLTADVWILGTTKHPVLRGDITSSGDGFLGIEKLYEFNLDYFRISWPDVPWQKGILDVSSSQELPYCNAAQKEDEETCPINLNIMGTITAPQIIPSSTCGYESSAASMYYNIFLGCISDENTSNITDWNKLAGKAIGKALSSTVNKTLGGEYVGDIDMKLQLFNSASTSEKDSSYFRVPISLDRWVKDLSIIFGYTQDQSENPTYDQSLELGINYTIPVFNKKDPIQSEHLSPKLTLNSALVSKQYITNTGTATSENRLEKNIGFNYSYRFWAPCILGFGKCEAPKIKPKKEEGQ